MSPLIFSLVLLVAAIPWTCDGASFAAGSALSSGFRANLYSSSSKCTTTGMPSRCLPGCQCFLDELCRKKVECYGDVKHLEQLLKKADPGIQVLNITAPPDRPNNVIFGNYFGSFRNLTELHITDSRVETIGERSFCTFNCGPRDCDFNVKVLDLSGNSLDNIISVDAFECLPYLKVLDLSHNNLRSTLSSGVFSKVPTLERLSLAHNGIDELVPSLFLKLRELRSLDLGHNYLQQISDSPWKHLSSLKVLNLTNNNIAQIEKGTFGHLIHLEELDLSHNKLVKLSEHFIGMKSLRVLRLNHNQLVTMADHTFKGLELNLLDLSHNHINPFAACTFCKMTTLKRLNLANNHLSSFNENLLKAVAHSLVELVLDNNVKLIEPLSSVNSLLQPLNKLRSLSLVNMSLSEELPASVFDNNTKLQKLNLSLNSFHELSGRMIAPLTALAVLDVSANQITFIDPATFNVINDKFLTHIYLHDNPYSCYRCHILPFVDWINRRSAAYEKTCPPNTSVPSELTFCARCAGPAGVAGRFLHEIKLDRDLEFCKNPETSLRVSTSDPNVGVILGLLIIISLVIVIVVVIAIYRKHGAVYYTQEDKLGSDEKIYSGSPELGRRSRQHPFVHAGRSITSTNFTFSPQSSLEQQQQPPLSPPGGPTEKNLARANSNGSAAAVVFSPGGPAAINNNNNNNAAQPSSRGDYACESCVNSPQVKQVIAALPAMTELIESRVVSSANDGLAAGNAVIMTTTAGTSGTTSGSHHGWSGGGGGHGHNNTNYQGPQNSAGGGDAVATALTNLMAMDTTPTSNQVATNNGQQRVAVLNEITLDFGDDMNQGEEYDDASKVHIYI